MFDKNKIFTIDFGTTHTTMMAAEVEKDKVKVLSVLQSEEKTVVEKNPEQMSLPLEQTATLRSCVKHGVVVQASDLAHQIQSLSKKMNDALKMKKGGKIDSMFVSVNAKTMKCVKHTVSRSFPRPVAINDDILSEMEDECRQMFTQGETEVYHIITIDYNLDNEQYKTPPDMKGRNLQVTYRVVIGNMNIKKKLLDIINHTPEITFKNFMPLSMEAIAEAVLSQEECDDGVALINFGATTTTLALYSEGELDTLMVVPLGSYNLTKDIRTLGISEANAEKVKITYGVAMESLLEKNTTLRITSVQPTAPSVEINTSFVAKIIEARLNEIFALIFEVLENNKNKIGAGIVLSGCGSKLKGFNTYLKKKTDLKITFGSHADKLDKKTNTKFADPFYSQLIGMSLLISSYKKNNPTGDADISMIWKKNSIKTAIKTAVKTAVKTVEEVGDNYFNNEPSLSFGNDNPN